MKINTLLLCLLLLGAAHATITLYAPANASTVYGTSQNFNWSDDDMGCTGANLIVFKGSVLHANISGLECSDNQTLTNLSIGSYEWFVSSSPANDTSVNHTFTAEPSINTSIIYPAPGTYWAGLNDCQQIVQIQTNDSEPAGATRSATCRLYGANSTTNPSYILIQSLSGEVNGTYNFTIPVSSNTSYALNCTATVSGYSANTQTTEIELLASSFCSGGDDDTTPGLIFLGTIILGFAFIYLAVEGEDV